MKKEKELDEQFGLRLVVRRREETEPEKEALEKGLRKQRIEGSWLKRAG